MLQGSADVEQGVVLASAVPESVLLNAAADIVDHGHSQADDMERVDHGDGLRQFVADGVGVAAERVQGGDFDSLVKSGPCALSQSP